MLDLWCINFNNSIQWLSFFNQCDDLNIEIIESTPIGQGYVSLFYCQDGKRQQIIQLIQTTGGGSEMEYNFINQPHEDLISGYLNVKNVEIFKSILAFESENLGHVLASADYGLKQGAELIEIRFPRINSAKKLLLLSGDPEMLKEIKLYLENQNIFKKDDLLLLENPSQTLKSFYNF